MSALSLCQNDDDDQSWHMWSRRSWLSKAAAMGGALGSTCISSVIFPPKASASIYLDPAMYGDQELRVSAVDSLREQVRRAVLQNPALSPSFYELAILDGLSYDESSDAGGPDGSIVKTVLQAAADAKGDKSPYLANLEAASLVLIDACRRLKKLSSITIGDAVAVAGAEAIEAIGGPVCAVQLGRMEPDKYIRSTSVPALDILSGTASVSRVRSAFQRSGLTDREMISLLGCLLTLKEVAKISTPQDLKQSSRGQFRERGKIGRMSEFKRLTDEDIKELEADDDDEDFLGDVEPYIADSFGTRDQVFGSQVVNKKESFNRFIKKLDPIAKKKSPKGGGGQEALDFGWISAVLTDDTNPGSLVWLSKYAGSTLTYEKDLKVAYNAVTQLGGQYTGGKYESLLKNKPRKTLNDDLDGLF